MRMCRGVGVHVWKGVETCTCQFFPSAYSQERVLSICIRKNALMSGLYVHLCLHTFVRLEAVCFVLHPGCEYQRDLKETSAGVPVILLTRPRDPVLGSGFTQARQGTTHIPFHASKHDP